MGYDLYEIMNRAPADAVMAETMPMSSSAWAVTLILIGYLLFVLKIGKQFMAKREPYNLKKTILVYNVIQIIWNATLFAYCFDMLFISRAYNLQCVVPLSDDHPMKQTERVLCYLYYLNKIADLMDTVFFVLRKSYKQITFLHVYHHIMMSYTIFWVIRIHGACGQYISMATMNTFVHTVMYSYYFISAMYPDLKGSLWWKKYITGIQLVQFVILDLQSLNVYLFHPKCNVPVFMQNMQLVQASAMLVMFGKFYFNSYVKPKSKKKL